MQNKTVFIVGPTGVGKTSLAFGIARKFNGALISADSVQVYKGLDIVSGKDLPKTATKNGVNPSFYIDRGIPIFLLDVVELTSSFSLHDFYNLATKNLETVIIDGKLPIVVGGTGLYVETLLNGFEKSSEPDLALRIKLEKLSVSELQKLLPKSSLKLLNESDRNNPRRLVRKIEQLKYDLQPRTYNLQPKQESLIIGLTCNREVLKHRIDERVDARLKNGALKEVEELFANYKNLSDQVKNANGYKQLFAYFKKEIDLQEAIYRWKISEYRHAKNQMTWFRKYGRVEWYDIEKENFKEEIEKKIRDLRMQ
jgi:tRNA dimethylallyltransferase